MSASTPKEIDLVQVFIRFLKYIKRYFWIFVVAIVIGVLAGIIKCKTSKPSYKSKMVVTTAHIPLMYAIDMVNTLNHLVKEQNFSLVSQMLNIDQTITEQILIIEAKAISDSPEKDPNRFEISIEIMENQHLSEISQGLDHYISTSPYTKERYELFLKTTKELLQKVESEITEINEFQKEMFKNISNNQNQTYILGLNEELGAPSSLIQLYKEKQTLETRLLLSRPFIVIENFIVFNQPTKSTLMYCLINSMIFLVLAIVYSLVRESMSLLKNMNNFAQILFFIIWVSQLLLQLYWD